MTMFATLSSTATTALWVLLVGVGALGMLAVISPRWFQSLATRGNHWVDSRRWLDKLDQPVDIDRYVLPYSRLFGALVVASVCLLWQTIGLR